MTSLLTRVGGFAVFPLLSLITPLLLLPIIATIVGPEGVSSIVSGQAIGTFAATVLMWGWNVEGPVLIARADAAGERGAVYLRSVRTRVALLVIVLPVTVIACLIVAAADFRSEAVAMAVTTGLIGLSPAWFCIGLGRPALLGLYDTLPRFLAAAAAVPLLLLTRQVWFYAGLLIITTVVALVLFQRRFGAAEHLGSRSLRTTITDLGAQRRTAGINVAGSAYASTPVPIVTVTSGALVSGSISTADTLYRFGLFTVSALGNAFQSWTIEPGASRRRQRHLAALSAHVVLGLVGAAILTLFGPVASGILFAGTARATTIVCFYYGLAFFFISASTPLIRNLLIPAGAQSLVLKATIASATLGVACMVGVSIAGAATLVPLGMAFSELVLCAVLVVPALRIVSQEDTDVR